MSGNGFETGMKKGSSRIPGITSTVGRLGALKHRKNLFSDSKEIQPVMQGMDGIKQAVTGILAREADGPRCLELSTKCRSNSSPESPAKNLPDYLQYSAKKSRNESSPRPLRGSTKKEKVFSRGWTGIHGDVSSGLWRTLEASWPARFTRRTAACFPALPLYEPWPGCRVMPALSPTIPVHPRPKRLFMQDAGKELLAEPAV